MTTMAVALDRNLFLAYYSFWHITAVTLVSIWEFTLCRATDKLKTGVYEIVSFGWILMFKDAVSQGTFTDWHNHALEGYMYRCTAKYAEGFFTLQGSFFLTLLVSFTTIYSDIHVGPYRRRPSMF